MRAAVTRGQELMEVVDVPEPQAPGTGEVLVRPEAVGLCGSDFHYFLGDLGTFDDPSALYPRVQGHEVSAILDVVGPGCPPHLQPGQRVALWPVIACGRCYPCRQGRGNACANIDLVGIHRDGALQEQLVLPATQVFPVGDLGPELTALIEPVSIAMRTVVRGRVAEGEHVVIFGAGPIGLAVALAAVDRGAAVLLVDRLQSRLALGESLGAHTVLAADDAAAAEHVRAWAGPDGPPVVVEATGVPELVQLGVDLVASSGRVLVVGLSSRPAPLRVGDLAFKEIDLLGVSCCGADEFAGAVDLVTRRQDVAAALVTHVFALDEAPAGMAYAIAHPADVMKAVVRLDQG